MRSCSSGNDQFQGSFDEILNAMQEDKYWINFFVRPCCPPPSSSDAKKSLERRREEIRSRSDFDDDQKSQLLKIVDEREVWYSNSPFCKGR